MGFGGASAIVARSLATLRQAQDPSTGSGFWAGSGRASSGRTWWSSAVGKRRRLRVCVFLGMTATSIEVPPQGSGNQVQVAGGLRSTTVVPGSTPVPPQGSGNQVQVAGGSDLQRSCLAAPRSLRRGREIRCRLPGAQIHNGRAWQHSGPTAAIGKLGVGRPDAPQRVGTRAAVRHCQWSGGDAESALPRGRRVPACGREGRSIRGRKCESIVVSRVRGSIGGWDAIICAG